MQNTNRQGVGRSFTESKAVPRSALSPRLKWSLPDPLWAWTVRRSNPCGDDVFRTRPDLSWAQPASYTMSTGSYLALERPGRGVNHPPLSSAAVKERVELYVYSPSGLLWKVIDKSYFTLPDPR